MIRILHSILDYQRELFLQIFFNVIKKILTYKKYFGI